MSPPRTTQYDELDPHAMRRVIDAIETTDGGDGGDGGGALARESIDITVELYANGSPAPESTDYSVTNAEFWKIGGDDSYIIYSKAFVTVNAKDIFSGNVQIRLNGLPSLIPTYAPLILSSVGGTPKIASAHLAGPDGDGIFTIWCTFVDGTNGFMSDDNLADGCSMNFSFLGHGPVAD